MPQRITIVFNVTTNPADRGSASPHSGGWTEGFWAPGTGDIDMPALNVLIDKRAALLPKQTSITGLRIAKYDLVGNTLRPLGASTRKLLKPGAFATDTDLPQVSVELAIGSSTSSNSARFVLRGMPDDVMKGGEYQPTPLFKTRMTAYCTQLVNSAACFLGRVLTNPTQRVLGIANNVVVLDGAIGAVVGTDYMRLLRVRDVNDNAVKGAVRIVGFAAPGTYTVTGLDGIVVNGSGFARVDSLSIFDIGTAAPVRAVVKKIGRPSESYRGRQSKR